MNTDSAVGSAALSGPKNGSRKSWDEEFARPGREHWSNNAIFIVPPGLGSLIRILTVADELGAQTITVHAALLNDPQLPRLARVAKAMGLTIELHTEVPNYWGEKDQALFGCDWHPKLQWAHPHLHRFADGATWRADPPDHRTGGCGLYIWGTESYEKRMDMVVRRYLELQAGGVYLDGLMTPIGVPTTYDYGSTENGVHLKEEVEPVLDMRNRLSRVDPHALLGAAAGAADIHRAPITTACPYVSPSDFRHELSFSQNVDKLERELREKVETFGRPPGAWQQRMRFGWMPLHLSKDGRPEWMDVSAASYFRERVTALNCPWWVQLHVDTWWSAPQRQAVSAIIRSVRKPWGNE